MKSEKIHTTSGREFNTEILRKELEWALPLKWIVSIWERKDALIDKNGGSIRLYTGQKYDTEYIDLVKNGWTHDHCDICASNIQEKSVCAISDNQIICAECYNDFIEK